MDTVVPGNSQFQWSIIGSDMPIIQLLGFRGPSGRGPERHPKEKRHWHRDSSWSIWIAWPIPRFLGRFDRVHAQSTPQRDKSKKWPLFPKKVCTSRLRSHNYCSWYVPEKTFFRALKNGYLHKVVIECGWIFINAENMINEDKIFVCEDVVSG